MYGGISYDLSDVDVADLTAELIGDDRHRSPKSGLACFRIAGSSRYANLARRIEAEVFGQDLGWQSVGDGFVGYEDHSYFFVSVDVDAVHPVGCLRIIHTGGTDVMTLKELQGPPHRLDLDVFCRHYGLAPERTWDVGGLAVHPRYRSSADFSFAVGVLYHSLYAGAMANGIDHFVSLVAVDTLGKLRKLGIPFDDILGMSPHDWGQGVLYQPAVARVSEFDPRMRAFAQAVLESSDSEEARYRARGQSDLIDALLTGKGFAPLLTFEHAGMRASAIR